MPLILAATYGARDNSGGTTTEKHLHTLEIIAIAGLSTAVTFHVFRFLGGKLALQDGAPGKVGRAVLGVFSFPAGG